MIAKQVFFEGRVQGVGFRYATKQTALGFDVTGWVKNLPDGRVELQVMGEDDEVDDFLKALQESNLAHHIQNVQIRNIAPLEDARGFRIVK